jgi:hypothetical protein
LILRTLAAVSLPENKKSADKNVRADFFVPDLLVEDFQGVNL